MKTNFKTIVIALVVASIGVTANAQVKKKTTTTKTVAKPVAKPAVVASKPTKSYNNGYSEKGLLQFNAGIGLSGWGTPVYAGLDYGITDDITIGAEGSYLTNAQYGIYSPSVMGIGGNANYHFNRVLEIPSKFDVYAGLSLNYYIFQYKNNIVSSHSKIDFGGQVGGRYFFSKNFGVNLELGGASATNGAKLGITLKL